MSKIADKSERSVFVLFFNEHLFSKDYVKSLLFLFKWIFIALFSGLIAATMIHFFDLGVKEVSARLMEKSSFLPFWTVLGAVVTGVIIYRIEPFSSGEGIPSYIKNVREDSGRMGLKITVFKLFAAFITLATFGNGGIVGPVGRVAAGLSSRAIQYLRGFNFTIYDMRTGAICGLAATIGAVFHSSIGGGIFAVEIIQARDMRYSDLFPAILASSTSVYVSKYFNWPSIYFFSAPDEFISLSHVQWLLVFSFLIGFLGMAFTGFYVFVSKLFRRDTFRYLAIKTVIGSAIAAFIAFFINKDLMGTGKAVFLALFTDPAGLMINNLESMPVFFVLIILLIVKAMANCVTVGSGMSAGFTGPALLTGMLFGAAFSNFIGVEFLSANYYAFLAAGFAGMLASSMNIPLAAAVIAVETFGLQYSFPAGLAAVIGFQINRHNTIYTFAVKDYKERQKDS